MEVGSAPRDHGDDNGDDDDGCDGYGRSRRRYRRSRSRWRRRPWWRKTADQSVAQTELETIQESSDPGHGGENAKKMDEPSTTPQNSRRIYNGNGIIAADAKTH